MHLALPLLRLRSRFSGLAALTALTLAAFSPVSALHAEDLPKVTVAATNPETGSTDRGPGVFTISLSKALNKPLTVVYSVKGTAVNGVDYVRLSGTKVIKAGKRSANINVVYKGSTQIYFPPETVKLILEAKPDYELGADKRATVTIDFVLP
jgi:hypothetical protein